MKNNSTNGKPSQGEELPELPDVPTLKNWLLRDVRSVQALVHVILSSERVLDVIAETIIAIDQNRRDQDKLAKEKEAVL